MKKGQLAFSERQNQLVNSADEITPPKVSILLTYSARDSIALRFSKYTQPVHKIHAC